MSVGALATPAFSRSLLAACSLQSTCALDRICARDAHTSSSQRAAASTTAGQSPNASSPSQLKPFKWNLAKAPKRRDFYHYRRKDLDLRQRTRERTEAARADGTHVPWLRRNLPVIPPPSVAVSALRRGPTPEKEFVFGANELAASGLRRDASVTKALEVLNMKVGNALDAQYALPEQVKAFVLDATTMCVFGTDKNQVTQIAAKIRKIKPPEPYKGAGIRVVGETLRLKEKKGKK